MRKEREIIFTFSCTHDAITGGKTLEEAGLAVRNMALPDQIGAGCGICLRVDEGERDRALACLKDAGILPQEIYLATRGPEGTDYTPI